MFESAELGHAVDRKTYETEVPELRARLLGVQADVFRKKEFPVLVVISGFEGAGKGDTLHMLHEWMDTRHIQTHAFDEPDDAEREHPAMWRYWNALPPSGDLGIYFGAWYRSILYDRVYGGEKQSASVKRMEEVVRFERMLTDEGTLLVKFWLHVSKKVQKKTLSELEANKLTRWRVKPSDWRNHRNYDKFREIAEATLLRTSTQHSPWIVVEGDDERYRRLTVARVLHDAMKKRLAEPKKVHVHAPPIVTTLDNRKLLRELDLKKALAKPEYEKRLGKAQGQLATLSRELTKTKRALMVVFEGNDAAGKGGAIRRMTNTLDARRYRVTAVAAPTEEERAHPYLWRFWRAVPRDGRIAIVDRSWYGRVLVERVEGFSPEPVWMRAYSEINDFESQLTSHGIVVVKFWMAISKAEQLRRFRSREDAGYKRFKITHEDWRNRKKWDDYEQAACDMLDRTSTTNAPWTVVEANDKPFARVKVIETVVARLKETL